MKRHTTSPRKELHFWRRSTRAEPGTDPGTTRFADHPGCHHGRTTSYRRERGTSEGSGSPPCVRIGTRDEMGALEFRGTRTRDAGGSGWYDQARTGHGAERRAKTRADDGASRRLGASERTGSRIKGQSFC